MKKAFLLAALLTVLLAAAPAQAKELLGAQLCGADACSTQRDTTLVEGPGGPLSGDSTLATPAEPGPWYRANLLLGDHGRVFGRLPFFYVPGANVIVQPGEGAQPTTWMHPDPKLGAMLERLAAKLKPLAVPRLTEVAVNGVPVEDPESYLSLYTVGGKPATYPTEVASIQITYQSEKPSPWTTGNAMVLYPRTHLLVRDGQLVQIPAAVAERAAVGASLDLPGSFPWLIAVAIAAAMVALAAILWRLRPRAAPQPVPQA